MKRKYKRIAKEFESVTGFDVVNLDEITDDVSASKVFQHHIEWLRNWAEEMAQSCERLLMDKGLYGLEPPKHASLVDEQSHPQDKVGDLEDGD